MSKTMKMVSLPLVLYLITNSLIRDGVFECKQVDIQFLCLEKLLDCFCSRFWVTFHLHCEALSDHLYSIRLNWNKVYCCAIFSKY